VLGSDVPSSGDEEVLSLASGVRGCSSFDSRELDHRAEAWHFPATSERRDRTGDPPPVVLTGLPQELCNEECMEVVLDQAGLNDTFLKCEVERGFCQGEARITFNSWESAEQCVAHFSHCNWNYVYIGVSAHFDDSMQSGQSTRQGAASSRSSSRTNSDKCSKKSTTIPEENSTEKKQMMHEVSSSKCASKQVKHKVETAHHRNCQMPSRRAKVSAMKLEVLPASSRCDWADEVPDSDDVVMFQNCCKQKTR